MRTATLPATPAAPTHEPKFTALELERVCEPPEAERLSTLSWDTIERHYADKVIHLSPRRRGMKLRDVISLRMPTA
jgi:hypothetical protein